MYGIRSRRDAEERGAQVEGHAVNRGRNRAPAELEELLALRKREDADDGACLGSSGEHAAVVVEGDSAERGLVGLDNIDSLEVKGIVNEHIAALGRSVLTWGRQVGGGLGTDVLSRVGTRVDEIAGIGRGR